MSAHILFPALEKDVPATMSRRIMSLLLRARLSFDGLTVSDCLMMDAVAKRFGTVEAAVAACAAGVDLLLVSHSPALAGEVCDALAARADEETLLESAARIASAKRGLKGLSSDIACIGCAEHRETARRLFERAVTHVGAPMPELGESPLFVGCPPLAASRASDEGEGFSFPAFMAARFGAATLPACADPDAEEIARAVRASNSASCIVLGTVNAHLKPGQRCLMEALMGTGAPMIVAALRDPYDLAALPEGVCGFACYDYAPESLAALAKVFTGELVPAGRLPVAFE